MRVVLVPAGEPGSKRLPPVQEPVLEPTTDAGGVLMALALERPQAASEPHVGGLPGLFALCQARGCGPRCSGPVRAYQVRAEDHCPECEADEDVHALVLLDVALCLAHAEYATDLGMIPLPGVR